MRGRKSCRIITSSRIGIFLLFLMLTWVYAFMNYAMYTAQPGELQSDRIRQRILDDSENYVKVLASEEKQGLNVQNSGVVYDLKRTLAVLLESILERLGNVEQKVDIIYANNSQLLRNFTSFIDHKLNQQKTYSENQEDGIFTNKKKSVVKKDIDNGEERPLSAKDLIMQPEAVCSYLNDDLRGYPDCPKKIAWMKEMWSSDPCYRKYGVDGSDCSFIIYLSEVETWCPKLKWRPLAPKPLLIDSERPKATIQTDKAGLMTVLNKAYFNKLEWVRLRIDRMWDSKWIPAAEALEKKQTMTNREQKKK